LRFRFRHIEISKALFYTPISGVTVRDGEEVAPVRR
jgi:hypothetical protein